MSIARIQIDFGMLEGEQLQDVLLQLGDLAMMVLDPHEDSDDCTRWVSIEAFEVDEADYAISFTADEDEELALGVPEVFRQNFKNN